jgi:hypothetical protein
MGDWYWTENSYGERPVDDVNDVIRYMDDMLGRSKATLCLKPVRLREQILEYLRLRHRHPAGRISVPLHRLNEPKDWDAHAEEVWTDWFQNTFTPERWTAEVLEPVFGTDQRFWEATIGPGWRMELYDMLHWWVQRDWYVVDRFDPLAEEDTGSNDEEEVMMSEDMGRRRR